jgi:hypothetical protein
MDGIAINGTDSARTFAIYLIRAGSLGLPMVQVGGCGSAGQIAQHPPQNDAVQREESVPVHEFTVSFGSRYVGSTIGAEWSTIMTTYRLIRAAA